MNQYYEKHVFICENQRQEGERPSCGQSNNPILKYLKQKQKEYDKTNGKIRIQRAGCFDRCEEGPLIVSYPDGIWFRIRTIEDANRFLEHYIQNGDTNPIQDLIVT